MISYAYGGKQSSDLELEYPADEAIKLDETAFLLVSGDDCYITRCQS